MNAEQIHSLQRSVARSEGLNVDETFESHYLPIFKHPLPVSEHRLEHEKILRKVLSCKLESQAFAAITRGDAWTLEEVYMHGAPVHFPEKSGHYPIHLAVQTNNVQCIMVLLRIGVDVNARSSKGYTPLYLARANRFHHISELLSEHGALITIPTPDTYAPSSTILDVVPEKSKTTNGPHHTRGNRIHDLLNIPPNPQQY